MVKISSDW
jgi:hypothetical protein